MYNAALPSFAQIENEEHLPLCLEGYLLPGEYKTHTTPAPEGVFFNETFVGPIFCPPNTDCQWRLILEVKPTLTDIRNVVVKETLSAELEIYQGEWLVTPSDIPPPEPPMSKVELNPMGSKPDKSSLNITWTISYLSVNEIASLEFYNVTTDKNPSGQQRYTSCDECYNLNSGPRLKYEYNDATWISRKYSDYGWVWKVYVPCPPAISLFSDALRILPIVVLSGALVVLQKRKR